MRIWIASSTSPPGGAGPSRHQLRLDPARACNCRRKKQRQKDKQAAGSERRASACREPSRGSGGASAREFAVITAARGVILELVAADPGDSEILAVAMAEVK